MADISLREYLAKLDTLLNDGKTDEVIHHCRHILKHFPKNADVYRYLGRALIYIGSWDKAADVFRRVLSVYPDDYIAHAGLSEAYLNLKRVDEAIWHLERAFEQEPNNQEIIESLRELYRKHRRVEQTRIQLTAGAAARQYIRSGLFGQAIDTLRKTLDISPERVDLRLLLARTYSEGDYPVEAGETALEVLRTLPDCLEANRILTEVWLSVQRPSDAQRYLSRIQSVDPYLALEIAQGAKVPDDKFRLEELDYGRSAREEIVSRTPDWLQDIAPEMVDAEPEADLADWMSAMPMAAQPSDAAAAPDFEDDLFSTELPDDWLESQPASKPEPEQAQPRRSGLTGLLATLNEPEDADEADQIPAAPPEPELENLADLFPQFAEEPPMPEPVEDVPAEPVEAPMPAQPVAARLNTDDPLAWLHESGIELIDEPAVQFEAFDDDDIAPAQGGESDPLAWLHDYGGENLIIDDLQPASQPDFEPDFEDEPLIETPPDEDQIEVPVQSGSQPPAAGRTPAAAGDPLDWLADETLLEEALSLETLTDFTETSAEDRIGAQQADVPTEFDGQGVMAEENQFDWMKSQDDKPQPDELPLGEDWFSGLDLSESEEESAEAAPAWMSEVSGEDDDAAGEELEWLMDEAAEEPAAASELADDLEWLGGADDDEAGEAQPTAMPDWLSDIQPEIEDQATAPEEPAAVGDQFAWLGGADDDEAGEAQPTAMPDWLSDIQPEIEDQAT
ncbi:MAG: tetratricopeptide repeat protein, partial [Chloroflexi bacterium]|nr:tetratricopeptide repeat protein [Chloroflexota bacterium]